jgi:predicted MFS family arabinose efflux permease
MVAADASVRVERRTIPSLFVIATISFLTLIDLFATQAILPLLTRAYGVTPAAMGSAVNLCTLGMMIAGIVVAWFGRHIDRRLGIVLSLGLLAIPTVTLSLMPSLTVFALLRLVQGLFMSAAFSLMIAYLAENGRTKDVATALAAYVTGNVASNLFGRLMSAAVADHLGLATNFAIFAALNLAGAALAFFVLRSSGQRAGSSGMMTRSSLSGVFAQSHLNASFAIGFLILFVFIGTFTYVNFVLTSGAIGLSSMQLGLVYFVFVPSIILTPLAGGIASRFNPRTTIIVSLGVAAVGLPGLLLPHLVPVLGGLTLVAAGTFFAQATATGYVSRMSGTARGQAGGLYLAAYYGGGLAGSIILGQIFDRAGWPATVAALAVALVAGCGLAGLLTEQARNSAAISES